jgi:hypothetical protein
MAKSPLPSSRLKYKALIWEGAPSEGNHRAGVLKFIAVSARNAL